MERTQYGTLEDDGDVTQADDGIFCCCSWLFTTVRNSSEEHNQRRPSSNGFDNPCSTVPITSAASVPSTPVETAWQTLQTLLDDSDDTGSSSPHGRLHFSIVYEFTKHSLSIKIHEAQGLEAKDANGTSDPYVKIFLLPAKRHKLTTHVKHKTLNPRWNESFEFEGYPFEKVLNSTLCLQVLDHDRFSKDDIIGELVIPMTSFDLVNGQTLWKDLQSSLGRVGHLGELCVSLCYDSTTSYLSVTVDSARNLKAKDLNGLSDPYVKIWLVQNGRRAEKKKTAVREATLNPRFDETLSFQVAIEQVRKTSLELYVMDFDRVGRNEPIGRVIVGPKSGPNEVKHWNEMLSKTKLSVTKWHVLRDCR